VASGALVRRAAPSTETGTDSPGLNRAAALRRPDAAKNRVNLNLGAFLGLVVASVSPVWKSAAIEHTLHLCCDSREVRFRPGDPDMMIRCWMPLFLSVATFVTSTRAASAQLSIQVPFVESFGGQFSGVVPDRGSVFLGGISRAGRSYSRGDCGCFNRAGGGMFVESTGLSASAWIHDLREMDRMVLDAADSPEAAARLRDSGLIDESAAASRFRTPAYRDDVFSRRERLASPGGTEAMSDVSRRLIARSRSLREANSSVGATAPATGARSASALVSDDELPRIVIVNRTAATQWYRLGKAAEDSGNRGIAKLHYRQAARYGSALALSRLKELSE
jgi:hypothetical protein